MIPIGKVRELLSQSAASFSDDEVERIRVCGYAWADAIVERWLRKKTLPVRNTDGHNQF